MSLALASNHTFTTTNSMSLLSTMSVIPTHVKLMRNKKRKMVKLCCRKKSMNLATPLCLSSINNTGIKKEALSAEMEEKIQPKEKSCFDGLGFVQFLSGKVFLVTGATGFLAKVLVEKLLRTVPDVGKIYMLIKAQDKDVAMERLKNEVITTELFNDIRQVYGKSYEAVMLSKLVPVVGNVRESGLGIERRLADRIANEVDFIVNSAANTTFDERYDIALDINTLGPCRVLSFAKRCKKLLLFMHVSTAYVSGQREGIIAEKKFKIGESIAREKAATESSMRSLPLLDVAAEIKMVMNVRDASPKETVTQKMKHLGFDRSRIYGWQDVYGFTKAMGEMMIESQRDEIPTVIIRPIIIESTYQEPVPGWIEGIRMMDPVILSYGKGHLRGFPVDPNGILDVIPADMVVNAMLAAMVKHGKVKNLGRDVYHIYSDNTSIDVKRMIVFSSKNDFHSHLDAEAARRSTSAQHGRVMSKRLEITKHLADIYEPYTFYRGRFDNTNTRTLMEKMSEEERMSFGFDVKIIDWKDYICNIHIPAGLMKYINSKRLI